MTNYLTGFSRCDHFQRRTFLLYFSMQRVKIRIFASYLKSQREVGPCRASFELKVFFQNFESTLEEKTLIVKDQLFLVV